MNPLLDLSAHPVVAHRGASAYAPENTLPAFELALQQGADALELDVRLTRDGAAVVMHDATVDRTTSLTGPVRSHTLAELRLADAGAWFTPDRGRTHPFAGASVRVPTLAEVLWSFPSVPVLIEVKEPEVQEAVRRVLVEENAAGRCVVAAEDARAVGLFRQAPFVCGACASDIGALYRAVLLRGRRLPPCRHGLLSVPLRYRGLTVPTRRFVAAARSQGSPVHVWTVDRASTARRLWRRGVSGIVSNRPDVIRAVRDE